MDLHFTPIQSQNIAYLRNFQHWLFGKCNWSERWDWLKGKSRDLFEDSSIGFGSGILITENETQKTLKVARAGVLFLRMKQTGFARLQRRLAVQGILFRTDVTVWYVSVSLCVSCLTSTSAFEHLLCLKAMCHTMRSLLQIIWMIIKINDAVWPVSTWAGHFNTKP